MVRLIFHLYTQRRLLLAAQNKAVVLRFEDRKTFEALSAVYEADPHRREQAVEFFCRVMGTVLDDVLLSGIFRVEGDVRGESE